MRRLIYALLLSIGLTVAASQKANAVTLGATIQVVEICNSGGTLCASDLFAPGGFPTDGVNELFAQAGVVFEFDFSGPNINDDALFIAAPAIVLSTLSPPINQQAEITIWLNFGGTSSGIFGVGFQGRPGIAATGPTTGSPVALAHFIGHNLGLPHLTETDPALCDPSNLMNNPDPQVGPNCRLFNATSTNLTPDQIALLRQSDLLQTVPAPASGLLLATVLAFGYGRRLFKRAR